MGWMSDLLPQSGQVKRENYNNLLNNSTYVYKTYNAISCLIICTKHAVFIFGVYIFNTSVVCFLNTRVANVLIYFVL